MAHHVFVLAIIGMALFALNYGRDLWNEHIVIFLLLYPIWGVLQQFLVQALGVANIKKLFPQLELLWVVLLGTCMSSIVHFPQGWLMLATGFMTCVFIPSYLQHQILWVLGLYHGWLGTLFYLWLLNQDPWVAAIS